MNRLQAWADQIVAHWLRSIVELPMRQPRATRKRDRVVGSGSPSCSDAQTPPRQVERFRVEMDEANGFVILDEQGTVVYSGTKSQCEDWLDHRENTSGDNFAR